jgi:2-polyprenyl-6-methoxyphenol hydroxylase-like FAD-dependent oxidoreductase
VRKQLGIAFPGVTSPDISRIARITIPADAVARNGDLLEIRGVGRLPLFQPNRTESGSVTLAPANALDQSAPDDLYIISTREPRREGEPTDELSEAELRASLRRVLGADLPFTGAFAARSTVANSRQAEHYRSGRVFLAGDAAHIFSAGGSALNVGLLDAIALGQKLAAVIRRQAPHALLDTYHAERHPAGQRTLAHTRVHVALEAGDEAGEEALREILGELVKEPAVAQRITTLIEG